MTPALSPDVNNDISGDEGEVRKPRATGSNNILCQNEVTQPEPEDDHLLDTSFQTSWEYFVIGIHFVYRGIPAQTLRVLDFFLLHLLNQGHFSAPEKISVTSHH